MEINYQEVAQWMSEFMPGGCKGAFVSLTYRCQCRCKHCGVRLFQRKNEKEMTADEIKAFILNHFLECGLRGVYFFGGEPTIHKDFFELIRYSREKGLLNRFDTNGIKLADKGFVKKIGDLGGAFVLVSLDSADPQVHDRFRGKEGVWKSAIQAIKNCVEINNIEVGISTVVTRRSLETGDTKKIIQLGKDLGVSMIRLLAPMLVGRWYKKEKVRLSKEELKELWSLLEPNFVFWEEACDGTGPFICGSMAKKGCAVTAYGDVQPCCYIPISFGNVKNERLKDILDRMWASSYFKQGRVNPLDCPMNDDKFREKILRLTEGKRKYPVAYDDSIFSAK